jgi:hypothetical protein
MEGEDFFKIIGFIVFGMVLIYYSVKCLQLQTSMIEGLTNPEAPDTTASPSSNGEAGNAANYAAAIKAKVVQLQDELLISKYRKDYENAIIAMDDYVSMLMLKQVLNMKPNDTNIKANMETINALNILKSSKDALNATMKFVDTQ